MHEPGQELYTGAETGAGDKSRDNNSNQELNPGAGAVRAREISCMKLKDP